MAFGKKKEATPKPPVASIKVGVKREAALDLGEEATITLTLVAPGLSANAVQAIMGAIDDEGYLSIDVKAREASSGKGTNNDKPGQ